LARAISMYARGRSKQGIDPANIEKTARLPVPFSLGEPNQGVAKLARKMLLCFTTKRLASSSL
jgi:hypothetical protein